MCTRCSNWQMSLLPTWKMIGKNYDGVINNLKDTMEKLFIWFQCNNFKASTSKSHFFSLTK